MSKSRLTAAYGMLTALALILGYVESLVPVFFAVPGMKLGLSNLVVLVALYTLGEKGAVFINLVRIVVSALLFSGMGALIFSLSGGILSLIVMIFLKRTGAFGMRGVSVAGGVSHNTGQLIAAAFSVNTLYITAYLPVLWIAGIVCGLVIGIVSAVITERMSPVIKRLFTGS